MCLSRRDAVGEDALPMWPRARRRTTADAPTVVLMYHRVADLPRDPLGLNVPPARFRAQLEHLRTLAPVVPVDTCREPAGGPRLCLTFDDGYADNAELAAPILRDLELPATFFVTTRILAEPDGPEFWWDALDHALFDRPGERPWLEVHTADGRDVRIDVRTEAARHRALLFLNGLLVFASPAEQQRLFAQLEDQVGPPGPPCARHARLDAATARELHDEGLISIGAHTRTHACLDALDDATAEAEIAGARADLTTVLGTAPATMAYPYGAPRTVSPRHFAMAERAGFGLAFTTDAGPVRPADARTSLTRIAANDVPPEELGALVAAHLG